MTKRLLTIAGWLLLAATAHAGTPIDERKAAEPNGDVEISNVAGEVRVTGWNRAEIEVTGELGDGTERLDFIRDGDLTVIKVVLPDRGNTQGSDLFVKVPQGSNLSVSVVSADVAVTGVRGRQALNTVSGDVEVGLSAGDAEVSTVSGDIQVRGAGVAGELSLEAVSGDLEVSDIAGELAASTVSGDITVAKASLTRLRANTTNGDIEVRSAIRRDGRVDIETTNGDVDLVVDGKDDLNIKVDTFNGDIDTCFGTEPQRTRRYGPGSNLRFTSGAGSRRLRVKTLNGDVEVCAD